LRNLAFNQSRARQVGFGEYVLIWIVSETAEKIAAIIVSAGETSSTDLDNLVLSCLDVAESWTDTCDMWSSIEIVGLASVNVVDIVPLLLVERNLNQGVNWSTDLW
jgi:hypothetical protein